MQEKYHNLQSGSQNEAHLQGKNTIIKEPNPQEEFEFKKGRGDVLLIACGATAREIIDLIKLNKWDHFDVTCLPAHLHNRPEKIPKAVKNKIRQAKPLYKKIFCLYADCGTGGLLDKVLVEENVERIAGPHCYSFYTGNKTFTQNEEKDFDAFYLTDYLAKHFDTLIWKGLAIDKYPELLPIYFGNYKKLIYLAQTEDKKAQAYAKKAAQKLGLQYEYRFTGYGDLEAFMRKTKP